MFSQALTQQVHQCKQAIPFVESLRHLKDPRDNRGKRVDLVFIIVAVVLAILSGRSKLSSIHRYIWNRAEWLRVITGMPGARLISRAHLPRLLALVPLDALNVMIETHFDIRLEIRNRNEWVAIDSKTLCGTTSVQDKQGERTLLAVTHNNRDILAQRAMSGVKSSEITAVRELLNETGLEKGKVTLDALHMNPITTAQINQAGGLFISQVKDNQKELRQQCQQIAAEGAPLNRITTTNKQHGRIEKRTGTIFDLENVQLPERWSKSDLRTLIVVKRQTTQVAKQKVSSEVSYYVSNQKVNPDQPAIPGELFTAIRQHWSVESDNWIRDVTFNEDHVKTKCHEQARTLAVFRTFAIRLLRQAKLPNFQASIEYFCDCPDRFESFLRQTNVV